MATTQKVKIETAGTVDVYATMATTNPPFIRCGRDGWRCRRGCRPPTPPPPPTDDLLLFFNEYKKLGGKRNRKSYDKINAEFVKHTFNAYMGYGCLENADDEPELFERKWVYYNRAAAIKGFEKATRCKETWRIFQSIDNVYAYT